jgi:hypothetical protein
MKTAKYILIIIFFLTSTAYAICPYPTPKLCSEYFDSDVIFTGKILKMEYISDPNQDNDNDWIEYTAKVKKTFRGYTRSITKFRTPNTTARWIGDVGKSYVIFLRKRGATSTCGPLDESEYVHKVDKEIDILKNASSSKIEGQVISKSGPWGGSYGIPVKDVQLKAVGKNKEFITSTDKDGKFTIVLPSGKYKLLAPEMQPSAYSRSNLQEINLQNGQCAQFQLIK